MNYNDITQVLKAIAHPTRIQIIEILKEEKELCVCHLYEKLDLEQSNVSQHLKLLKSQNILSSRKIGLKVMYKIEMKEAINIINETQSLIQKKISKMIDSQNGGKDA